MADAVLKEIRKPDERVEPKIESADLWGDLRATSLPLRFMVCIGLGALAAYALWFGLLAGIGIWRRAFLDLLQLGVVVGGLAGQSAIVWALRLAPMSGAGIFGVLWGVPLALIILINSTTGDYLHATLAVLSPIALSLLNACFCSYFFRQTAIPLRRGE